MQHFSPGAHQMAADTHPTQTMHDAFAHVRENGTASQLQDIRKATSLFTLHGIEGPMLASFPAAVTAFEKACPKFLKTKAPLLRLIDGAGISEDTYKQNWRAAKRLIETVTGQAAQRAERKSRNDCYSDLLARIQALIDVGIVPHQAISGLASLIDALRKSHVTLQEFQTTHLVGLQENSSAAAWKKIKSGLVVLDGLRAHHSMLPFLPAHLLAPSIKARVPYHELPAHLKSEAKAWIDRASREQTDPEFADVAKPLSKKDRAVYAAAFRCLGTTMSLQGVDLSVEPTLIALCQEKRLKAAITSWRFDDDRTARTHFSYANKIALALERNGHASEGAYIRRLIKDYTYFQEGRNASKTMGRSVKKWCMNLLGCPKKTALFQTQHLYYYALGLQALKDAREANIDLRSVANPRTMKALPKQQRSRAKEMLRRARLFGVMAAYAAIELEGAPYRRSNVLSLRHQGPRKTFFDQMSGKNPKATIKFPNEELKNGKFLSARGEELEAIEIQNRTGEDCGVEILRWYRDEIRTLFPEGSNTNCLFPPITRAATSESGLSIGTFNNWLSEASAEIGLPMTSHNFRHGYCSIEINSGGRSMMDLAKIMGDQESTVRRFYAWINVRQSNADLQDDVARRRAEIIREKRAAG